MISFYTIIQSKINNHIDDTFITATTIKINIIQEIIVRSRQDAVRYMSAKSMNFVY